MNVSSKHEGRRAAQGTFANGLKVALAAILTVVLVLQSSNLQAYADDLLGTGAPEEEVVVSDVVDDETEGEKDDTVVTDGVETESDDEDVVTETEDETPPAAETEETEETEAPKATTTSVEPQLLSTTSAQPTNASTRAGEMHEIKIGQSKTIDGTGGLFTVNHQWTVEDDSVVSVNGDGSSATVTGRAEGSTTVTHTWGLLSGNFEKFFVTVKGVNVYFYTLVPGVEYDPEADADTQWNGMGVGTVYGLKAPSNYDIEEIVYEGDDLNTLLNDSENVFPTNPSIIVGGKEYTYAAPGSPEAMQADHYTIEWTRLKVASGANAGANGVNQPTVPEGTPTYHLDGRVTLIDEDKIQVGFQVKQPNATEFDDPIAKYYLLYDKNVAYNEIVVPGDTDVPSYKTVNGVQYFFDGWYTDEACTQKVNFEYDETLSENTTFYGRYVPDRDVLTYDPNGGTGEKYTSYGWVSTGNTAKVQDNRFTAPEGKVFDSWNTKADGSGTPVRPGDTYTLSPDVDDVLYAQWKDDLSDFNVAGGTWLYDGTMHGVTVSGVKAGDKLTYEYTVNGELSYTTVDITADNIEKDGTVKGCGPINVTDDGGVKVTLARNGADVATGTATVIIEPRKITLTSKDLSKEYDGTELRDSAIGNCLTVTGDGFASNESYGNVSFTGSQTMAGESENAFTYELIGGSSVDKSNYDITLKFGTLTVTPVTITVTADDLTKVEGEADPPLTTSYDSRVLVGSEKPGWDGEVVREAGEEPGSYAINQGTLALANGENGFLATNYKLEFVPGTLTITAADDGDDDTPVTPVDPVDPGDDDDNPGGGGDNPVDNTNPGGGTGVTPGGGTTTGGGTNPVPVAATTGDDADDAVDDAEDEEAIEEDETPLADGAETDADGEEIADDDTPLASGETDEQTCMMHWAMLAGIAASAVYFVLSAVNTRRATSKLASFEDDVLGRR